MELSYLTSVRLNCSLHKTMTHLSRPCDGNSISQLNMKMKSLYIYIYIMSCEMLFLSHVCVCVCVFYLKCVLHVSGPG